MIVSIPMQAGTLALAGGLVLSMSAALAPTLAPSPRTDFCNSSAELAYNSSMNAARADYLTAIAGCINVSDSAARNRCVAMARAERDDAFGLIQDQLEARQELCAALGPGRYNPVIDPANFVSGIDNPYLPWVVGRSLVYEAQTDEGLEVITVTVEEELRTVQGIECTVVRDVVVIDGDLIEDTQDWFAQDVVGNVWYFGELVLNYEDNELVDISGSWEAGVDGAQAGIVMQAAPTHGMTYRLEFLVNEAEDAARVSMLGARVVNADRSYDNCLVTQDFTPLDPEALENKFYAPGIGLVLETKPGTEERLELVAIIDKE